jgi:hypothetical protein
MIFAQFCDTAENTEQEQRLLQFFKSDDMKPVEEVFTKMARVPIVGKILKALVALGDYESIAAFRLSEHYQNLKDWNFNIDFDKKSMSVTPNDEQKKKAMKVLAVIGVIITLIILCRKFCRRKECK